MSVQQSVQKMGLLPPPSRRPSHDCVCVDEEITNDSSASVRTITVDNHDDIGHNGWDSFRPVHEAVQLARISLPIVIVQICSLLLWTETASAVGRAPDDDRSRPTANLAGFALASPTANLVCNSIFIGILSASDTLSPQAYGAGNYREMGLLAIRAYVSAFAIVLPLAIVLWNSEAVLLRIGQDPHTTKLAARWVRVYLAALPFYLLLSVVQRFLTSQEVVLPLVYCGIATAVIVHPLNLYLWVYHVGGFIGSAVALVLSQTAQVLLLLAYLKWKIPHNPKTWPGLKAFRDAVRIPAVLSFVRLGFGGLLALTEWWFWEFLCFVAGKFGVVSLNVHTVAYQMMPLLFMVPLGIGIGLSVRLGSILATDVLRAKKLVMGCLVFCILLAAAMACAVHFSSQAIISLFTSDEEVIQGCLEIWPYVSQYVFLDALFATNSAILRALGLQWRQGFVVAVGLWLMAAPGMYYFSVVQGGGLCSLWRAMPPAYVVLNIALFLCYYFADWAKISAAIQRREGSEGNNKPRKNLSSSASYGAV